MKATLFMLKIMNASFIDIEGGINVWLIVIIYVNNYELNFIYVEGIVVIIIFTAICER